MRPDPVSPDGPWPARAAGLLFALVLPLYLPLLGSGFVWEDLGRPGSASLERLHSLAWMLGSGVAFAFLARRLAPGWAWPVGLALFLLHPLRVPGVALVDARLDQVGLCLVLAGLVPSGGSWRRLLGLGLAICGLALSLREGLPLSPEFVGPAAAFQAQALLWPVHNAPGLNLRWPPPAPWQALALLAVLVLPALALGRRRALLPLLLLLLGVAPALVVREDGLLLARSLGLSLSGLALLVAVALGRSQASLLLLPVLSLALLFSTGRAVGQWRSDDALALAALQSWPSPWSRAWSGIVLERRGALDEARAFYLEAISDPLPESRACQRLALLSLERGQPADVLLDGAQALEGGCGPLPELRAPMAYAQAWLGQWDRAEVEAMQVSDDNTGIATTVRLAAGARRGELGPLRVWQTERPDDPPVVADVVELLRRAGEEERAAWVEAQDAPEALP